MFRPQLAAGAGPRRQRSRWMGDDKRTRLADLARPPGVRSLHPDPATRAEWRAVGMVALGSESNGGGRPANLHHKIGPAVRPGPVGVGREGGPEYPPGRD